MERSLRVALVSFILSAFLVGCGGGGGSDSGGASGAATDNAVINPGGSSSSDSPITGVQGFSDSHSVVSILFQVFDANDNPVQNLATAGTNDWEDNFTIFENGQPVNVESFSEIRPRLDLTVSIPTVVVLDISSSVLDGDLTKMLDSVRDSLIDVSGSVPVSKLLPQQSVALIVFDGQTQVVQNLTKDANVIANAIATIRDINRNLRVDNNSTDLYGAVLTGLELWENSNTTTNVTKGFLVVAADAEDTSNEATEADVIAMREEDNKAIFTIPLPGAGSSLDTLASEAAFALSETGYDELGASISGAVSDLENTLKALYVFEYLSPLRDGTHNTVTIRYDNGAATLPTLTGTFSAELFAGTFAFVDIEGDTNVKLNSAPQYVASTKFSNSASVYEWALDGNNNSPDLSDVTGEQVSLINTTNYGQKILVVTDTRGTADPVDDRSKGVFVNVTDTEVAAATLELEGGESVVLYASTSAASTPSFAWQASITSENVTVSGNCSIDVSDAGTEATLSVARGFLGTCYVFVTDAANGNSLYILPVKVGNDGDVIVLTNDSAPTVLDFEDGTSNGVTIAGNWFIGNAPSGASSSIGSAVMQSPSMSNDEVQTASFVVPFTRLSFDYRVSSESNFDIFTLLVDGVEELVVSGDDGWVNYSKSNFSATEHTVEFRYAKDQDKAVGLDAVFVDNLIIQ